MVRFLFGSLLPSGASEALESEKFLTLSTVTNVAKLCFILLLWHPLSSNLIVCCAKIRPKIKIKKPKPKKSQKKNVEKWCFFDGLLKLLNFRPNFSAPNHQIWMDNFASLDTPKGVGQSSRVICIWKIFKLFRDGGVLRRIFSLLSKCWVPTKGVTKQQLWVWNYLYLMLLVLILTDLKYLVRCICSQSVPVVHMTYCSIIPNNSFCLEN